MRNWMSKVQDDTKFMSLIMPGTHNSAAYELKDFLWNVKDYTLCQDYEVYDQLMMGVRFLDLRICKY